MGCHSETGLDGERDLTRELARAYVEGLRARIAELETRLAALEEAMENGRKA